MQSATANQLSFPFYLLEEEMLSPINGQELSEIELYIANLLLDATSEKPLKMAAIIEAVADALGEKLSERKVKLIVKSLRDDRSFPILSRRSKPAGYYWCKSEQEFKEFEQMWFSQIMSEIYTIQKLKKRNYPRLAGQMRLPIAVKG